MPSTIKRRFVKPLHPAIILALVALSAGAVAATKPTKYTVNAMPPAVVKTVPQSGDTKVDPSLKEIRVTFSKDMMTDGMWAWVQVSKEAFPHISGKVRYLKDKRTCVAPVSLEPNKAYVIWFNKGKFNSFRDTGNRPAVPYLLVFETKQAAKSAKQVEGFENDPQVLGRWTSVDFVKNISDFNAESKSFKGTLYLKEFVFAANGKTHKPFWIWTKGSVYHHGDKTTAKYTVKTIGKEDYLFLEWMSGDVTIRGQKPRYYVLKKEQ